jgi:hypothetical protein
MFVVAHHPSSSRHYRALLNLLDLPRHEGCGPLLGLDSLYAPYRPGFAKL